MKNIRRNRAATALVLAALILVTALVMKLPDWYEAWKAPARTIGEVTQLDESLLRTANTKQILTLLEDPDTEWVNLSAQTDTQAAREMIRVSRQCNARLGVIFQNRYNPASKKLKELVASGVGGKFLGARASVCWHREKPYYVESGWRGSMTTEGGGTLINQSIHTLDLLTYIAGQPIVRVRGHVSTDRMEDVIDVETACHALAEYADGTSCVFHVTNDYVIDAPIQLEMTC